MRKVENNTLLMRILTIQYIRHPKESINPNKIHYLSQLPHQCPKLLLSTMILVPIHKTHRIKRKVDMRDSGVLVDGIGNLMALAEETSNLVGGIEDVLYIVNISRGEGDDKVIDPDALVFSEGPGGLGH